MKKIVAISLLLTIVCSTVGIAVAHHYCKVAVVATCQSDCCNQHRQDCCNNELKVYKLDYVSLLSDKIRVDASLIPAKSFFNSIIECFRGQETRVHHHPEVPPILFSPPYLQSFLI